MHANCYISLSSKRKFEQSLKRKDQDTTEITSEKSADNDDKESSSATVKGLRSLIDGPVHTKDKCIWCMKGADIKHPDRQTSKLNRIATFCGWREFRRHQSI